MVDIIDNNIGTAFGNALKLFNAKMRLSQYVVYRDNDEFRDMLFADCLHQCEFSLSTHRNNEKTGLPTCELNTLNTQKC